MNYFPVLGVFIIFIYIQKQYIHDLPTISLSKNSAILAKGFCFCSFCSGKTTTWVEFISRFRPYCRSVFLVLDSACQSIPISLCSLLFQNYRANFTHFEQKNTHISGCKNVSNRVYIFMSYSTHVYLHGYCSSFIIILLISSLSDSHLNSLSFHHKADQLLLLLQNLRLQRRRRRQLGGDLARHGLNPIGEFGPRVSWERRSTSSIQQFVWKRRQ